MADYFIGPDQKVRLHLGEVETAARIGIESQVGDSSLIILGLWFSF